MSSLFSLRSPQKPDKRITSPAVATHGCPLRGPREPSHDLWRGSGGADETIWMRRSELWSEQHQYPGSNMACPPSFQSRVPGTRGNAMNSRFVLLIQPLRPEKLRSPGSPVGKTVTLR